MSYQLDEGIEESFDFVIGGNTYTMRYPNTEEVTGLQKLSKDVSAESIEDQLKWIYPLVSKDKESSPDIGEALKKTNIKKLQKFVEMIKKEFGTEE